MLLTVVFNILPRFYLPCSGGLQCGPPPGPLNAKVFIGAADPVGDDPNQLHNAGTSVTFICDTGFELIG